MRFLVFLSVVFLLFSCQDEPPLTVESFNDAVLTTACEKYLACCPGGVREFSFKTLDECKKQYPIKYFDGIKFDAAANVWHESEARECLDAFKKHYSDAACGDDMPLFSYDLNASCRNMITGNGKKDEKCDAMIPDACEEGTFCAGAYCKKYVFVESGAACDLYRYKYCEPGLWCEPSASKCVAGKKEGETCGSDKDCASYSCSGEKKCVIIKKPSFKSNCL